MNFSSGMRDELTKIALDDDAKLRALAFLRTTGGAMVGTALGLGTADLIRHGIANKIGPEMAHSVGVRAATMGIPAVLGIAAIGTEAALRHHINKERERYIAQRQSQDEAERMKADMNYGIVQTPDGDRGSF